MITRNRIRQIISEAAGVPDDIDMMTNIFTNMVKDYIGNFKQSGEDLDVGEADIKNYGETEFEYGKIEITEDESWNYVKNSPLFDEEKWKKFPMYKNSVEIFFSIYPDEALDMNNINKPNVNAAHQFEPSDFGSKETEGVGKTYNSGNFEFKITMGQSNWDDLETLSPNIDAVIAHEVFHSYQLFVKYNKTNKIGFGKEHTLNTLASSIQKDFTKEFNYFLHALYLSLRFEQQARIPQTLKVLKTKNINDYNDFISELKKTDAYSDVETLKSFSADKLIKSLSSVKGLEDLFRKPMAQNHMKFAIENWNNILEHISDHAKSSGITTSPFRGMSQKLLENPELFFKHWEKVFDRRGDEFFRKLSKLYALL